MKKLLPCVLLLSLSAGATAGLASCSDDPAAQSPVSPAEAGAGSDAARDAQLDSGVADSAQPATLPLVVTGQSAQELFAVDPPDAGDAGDAGEAGAAGRREGIAIELSNRAGNCYVNGNVGDTVLSIQLLTETPPLAPGTYAIALEGNGKAIYTAKDAQCAPTFHSAVSGTVVLSAVSMAPMGVNAGTYDVTFENGVKLKGSFGAPWCTAPADLGQPSNCP